MERKKKVKKRENQPTIDPFSPGVGGVGGWGASKFFAKKKVYSKRAAKNFFS